MGPLHPAKAGAGWPPSAWERLEAARQTLSVALGEERQASSR
jgi:hypothetical protein